MQELTTSQYEAVDEALIEAIYQQNIISLGEGPVICQACGQELREGTELTAYAFRPGRHTLVIEYTRCVDHPPAFDTLATRGVYEYTLNARLGRCVDQAYQRQWPVLLDPTIETTSSRSQEAQP